MEFYSERCQDWLNKSQRIHPEKLAMEVERFKKMYHQCQAEDADAKEDLALTVQLLEERLQADQLNSTATDSVEPLVHPDIPPESCQLSYAPNSQDPSWDLTSLTDPADIEVETLDTKTKAARKQALLNHPSIALGTSAIQRKD